MSQDVSVRGTGGAIFAGTLLILGAVLWIVEGLAGIVRGTDKISPATGDQPSLPTGQHRCRSSASVEMTVTRPGGTQHE
jgi:hypothetical protein